MGKSRADDRPVLSGMIFINRHGFRWCDAPEEYGPAKTLYNRWKRWGDKGDFARMMEGQAYEAATPKTVMIDVSGHGPLVRACLHKYLKAHPTATSLRSKGAHRPKRPPDWQNQVRHEHQTARCHRRGRSPDPLLHDWGQVGDYADAPALLDSLPTAEWLLADRGCDAGWLRDALKDKGIKACIPGWKSRGKPNKHDKRRYKRRNRIEIVFGRLKDWRRVATR
jgi:transposase